MKGTAVFWLGRWYSIQYNVLNSVWVSQVPKSDSKGDPILAATDLWQLISKIP
jgi:hypothetical protein